MGRALVAVDVGRQLLWRLDATLETVAPLFDADDNLPVFCRSALIAVVQAATVAAARRGDAEETERRTQP